MFTQIRNFFRNLKPKEQMQYELTEYTNNLAEMLQSMFEYSGIFKNAIYNKFIEQYLLAFGKCAIFKNENDKLICSYCDFCGGNLNEYGILSDLICTTQNGKQYTFKNWDSNENVVVIFNNNQWSGDLTIDKCASFLAETDTSIKCCIVNSRYSPIVSCKNSKTRNIISKIFEGLTDGQPKSITDGDLMGNKSIDVINVTDVKNSDKLQYLTHFKDDIFRFFLNTFGLSTFGSGKMAQQTEEEINNNSNASFVIPDDMLYWRKLGILELNRKFNLNASVDFSDCWRNEKTRCIHNMNH